MYTFNSKGLHLLSIPYELAKSFSFSYLILRIVTQCHMENILPNANKKVSLTKTFLTICIYTYSTFPDIFTYDACDLSDFTFFSHMDTKLFLYLVSFLGCLLLLNSHFVCLYHRSCFIVITQNFSKEDHSCLSINMKYKCKSGI